jgi:hypothetical protein
VQLGQPDGREGFGKPKRTRGEKCSNGRKSYRVDHANIEQMPWHLCRCSMQAEEKSSPWFPHKIKIRFLHSTRRKRAPWFRHKKINIRLLHLTRRRRAPSWFQHNKIKIRFVELDTKSSLISTHNSGDFNDIQKMWMKQKIIKRLNWGLL